MREFSKVYQTVWTSTKFESLPDDGCKLLYLYILTNQHSNSSGCYNLKPGYATADLNWTEQNYLLRLDTLSKALLIEVENGFPTVLITKWPEFNEPMNAKHAVSVLAQLDTAASLPLKHKRGQEFTAIIDRKKYTNDHGCGARLATLCEPYRYGIDTVHASRPSSRPETRDRDLAPDLDQTRDLDLKTRMSENGSPVALASLTGGATALTEQSNISPLLQTKFMKKATL